MYLYKHVSGVQKYIINVLQNENNASQWEHGKCGIVQQVKSKTRT